MPAPDREHHERLPTFYVSPVIKGLEIGSEIQTALERLWPWFWNYVALELGDAGRAAELADQVAYSVSKYAKNHPGEVQSFGGLCRVAAVNLITKIKTKEARIGYCGLSHDIEEALEPMAPDWQRDVELSIWIDEVLRGQDREIRTMLELRLLNRTWPQIGKLLGLTAGQARLRLYRALAKVEALQLLRINRGRK